MKYLDIKKPYSSLKLLKKNIDSLVFGHDTYLKYSAISFVNGLLAIPLNQWFGIPLYFGFSDFQDQHLNNTGTSNITLSEKYQSVFLSNESITKMQTNCRSIVMILYYSRILIWSTKIGINLMSRLFTAVCHSGLSRDNSVRDNSYLFCKSFWKLNNDTLDNNPSYFFYKLKKQKIMLDYLLLIGLGGYLVYAGNAEFSDNIKQSIEDVKSIPILSMSNYNWSSVSELYSAKSIVEPVSFIKWPQISPTKGINLGILPLILVGAFGAYPIYRNAVYALFWIGFLSFPVSFLTQTLLSRINRGYSFCTNTPNSLCSTRLSSFFKSYMSLVTLGILFGMRYFIVHGMDILLQGENNQNRNSCADGLSAFSLFPANKTQCSLHSLVSPEQQVHDEIMISSLGGPPYHPWARRLFQYDPSKGANVDITLQVNSTTTLQDYYKQAISGDVAFNYPVTQSVNITNSLCNIPPYCGPNGDFYNFRHYHFSEQLFYSVLSTVTISEIYTIYPVLASAVFYPTIFFFLPWFLSNLFSNIYTQCCQKRVQTPVSHAITGDIGTPPVTLLIAEPDSLEEPIVLNKNLKQNKNRCGDYASTFSSSLNDIVFFGAQITSNVSILFFIYQLIVGQSDIILYKENSGFFNKTIEQTTSTSLLDVWRGIFSQIWGTLVGTEELNPMISYIGLFHIKAWTNVIWFLPQTASIVFGVVAFLFSVEKYFDLNMADESSKVTGHYQSLEGVNSETDSNPQDSVHSVNQENMESEHKVSGFFGNVNQSPPRQIHSSTFGSGFV